MKKMVFIVKYVDDFHKPHITFVTSMAEVNFIRSRFGFISVETFSSNK